MKRRRGDARLYQPLPIYGDALPRGGTAGANMKGTDTQARPQSRFTARCHVQQQQASALGATNSATLAVAWVERPEDMRALWYGGCFGKGSWNRSQPGLEPGEHLQLTHAETMFLAHSLGVLRLEDGAGREISAVRDLWQSFVGSCLPVPVTRHALLNALCLPSIAEFVSYHYYRAQGWWVRSGVKYGTDWTLYENSPSMSHSKYAVLVVPAVVQIPAEQSEYCSSGENDQRDVTVDNDGCSQLPVGLRVLHQGKIIGWSDYFTSLRLLVNVKKRLRLCFVVAPLERVDTGKSRNVAVANDGFAPSADTASYTALLDTTLGAGWQDLLARLYADPDACLDFYRVLEFDFFRWTPDRTR